MSPLENSAKKILVTGGAGFIGAHLVDRLLAQGHDVLCVDNLYTGREQNIAHLRSNPNFEFMHHDVSVPLFVDVDEIYNLACPASPVHYQHDPIQTVKTSVIGAMNMLGLAKRLDARIFQASTSEIYGDPEMPVQSEDYWGHVNPIGLRGCYDEGKRCAETLFFDYHRQHGIDIKVARIFNTYGPRMHHADGRVVSNFVVRALQGAPLMIHGDGSYTRSFCYVDDLLDGVLAFMATDSEMIGPVNLGNTQEVTVLELAQLVLRLTGSPSKISFVEGVPDDPKRRCPDLSLARAKLGWSPKITLEDGITRTIAYFRACIG